MEELLRRLVGERISVEYGTRSFIGRVSEVSRDHVTVVNDYTSSGTFTRLISLGSVHAVELLDA